MKKSFTLIEILVVATIIALLATAATITYAQLTKQSRDARRKTDLEQIRAALEMYRSNNNQYYPYNNAKLPNFLHYFFVQVDVTSFPSTQTVPGPVQLHVYCVAEPPI